MSPQNPAQPTVSYPTIDNSSDKFDRDEVADVQPEGPQDPPKPISESALNEPAESTVEVPSKQKEGDPFADQEDELEEHEHAQDAELDRDAPTEGQPGFKPRGRPVKQVHGTGKPGRPKHKEEGEDEDDFLSGSDTEVLDAPVGFKPRGRPAKPAQGGGKK